MKIKKFLKYGLLMSLISTTFITPVFADKEYKFELKEPLQNQRIIYEWDNEIENLGFQMLSPSGSLYDYNYDKIDYDERNSTITISFPEMEAGTWKVFFTGPTDPKNLTNRKEEFSVLQDNKKKNEEAEEKESDIPEFLKNKGEDEDEDAPAEKKKATDFKKLNLRENYLELGTMLDKDDLFATFKYDKEAINIIFVNPDGKDLDIVSGKNKKAAEQITYEYDDSSKTMVYTIHDAEEGVWGIKYENKTNTKILYAVESESLLNEIEDEKEEDEIVNDGSYVKVPERDLKLIEKDREKAKQDKKEKIQEYDNYLIELEEAKKEHEESKKPENEREASGALILEDNEVKEETEQKDNVIVLENPNNVETVETSANDPLVKLQINADEERQKQADRIKRQASRRTTANVVCFTPLIICLILFLINLFTKVLKGNNDDNIIKEVTSENPTRIEKRPKNFDTGAPDSSNPFQNKMENNNSGPVFATPNFRPGQENEDNGIQKGFVTETETETQIGANGLSMKKSFFKGYKVNLNKEFTIGKKNKNEEPIIEEESNEDKMKMLKQDMFTMDYTNEVQNNMNSPKEIKSADSFGGFNQPKQEDIDDDSPIFDLPVNNTPKNNFVFDDDDDEIIEETVVKQKEEPKNQTFIFDEPVQKPVNNQQIEMPNFRPGPIDNTVQNNTDENKKSNKLNFGSGNIKF